MNVLIVLGGDAVSCVFLGDAVPGHDPLHPCFHRGADRHGYITQFRQTAFEQTNGIDGSQLRPGFQTAQHFLFHRAVGDAVQVRKSGLIGKDNDAQFFSLELSVLYGAGEPVGDGPEHFFVGLE